LLYEDILLRPWFMGGAVSKDGIGNFDGPEGMAFLADAGEKALEAGNSV
jgi:hypothetical protein